MTDRIPLAVASFYRVSCFSCNHVSPLLVGFDQALLGAVMHMDLTLTSPIDQSHPDYHVARVMAFDHSYVALPLTAGLERVARRALRPLYLSPRFSSPGTLDESMSEI